MITLIKDVAVLSDDELLAYSVKLARHENDIGLELIACLREAEKRLLFSKVRMSSLWEYATRHLGLSNGNAQMKIDAMRLSRDNNVAQEKIATGELSILNAAKVNSFFRQEKKAGHAYTPKQKAEVIESVLGLSQSKCERALLALAPESVPDEKVRPLTETKTEVKMVIDESTMTILNRLRELLSHKMPHATYAQLLDYLAREKVAVLEKKLLGASLGNTSPVYTSRDAMNDRKQEKIHAEPGHQVQSVENERNSQRTDALNINLNNLQSGTAVTPPTGVKNSRDVPSVELKTEVSRSVKNGSVDGLMNGSFATPRLYVSIKDRRWVMSRANGQCEHVDESGHRCTSRWKIELDHIVPLIWGGTNERDNYRAVCRFHNLYYANMKIGNAIMKKYVSSLN